MENCMIDPPGDWSEPEIEEADEDADAWMVCPETLESHFSLARPADPELLEVAA